MNTSFEKLVSITVLALIALYIALPSQLHIYFKQGPISVDQTFERGSLNINLGPVSLRRSLDLVLGLDLAGGSQLAFEADTSNLGESEKGQALESAKRVIERRVNFFGVSEPNVQVSSFAGKDRILVELPGVRDVEEAVSLIGKTAQLEFANVNGEGDETMLVPTSLTGADLKRAQLTFDQRTGNPSVSIEFSQEGTDKFAQITKDNVGRPVAILLDGEVISAPVVQEEITTGQAVITGSFDTDSARELTVQLNAGALPLPISLVEQRTIGASLGADSVAKSVQAGVIGVGMVLIFMVLAYGRLGLVACIGLVVYGVITLSLYKLIPVVLTLPGVAGFLLSVGMAVDSNILIFERFKEERTKRPIPDALEVSFGRAWDSIRDANIATLFTAFILANPLDWNFLHTSGPVRGFAITLAIGIGISLFTGIVVSRNLLRFFIREEKRK